MKNDGGTGRRFLFASEQNLRDAGFLLARLEGCILGPWWVWHILGCDVNGFVGELHLRIDFSSSRSRRPHGLNV